LLVHEYVSGEGRGLRRRISVIMVYDKTWSLMKVRSSNEKLIPCHCYPM